MDKKLLSVSLKKEELLFENKKFNISLFINQFKNIKLSHTFSINYI